MVKFINMDRARTTPCGMKTEIKIDGKWIPVTRRVTGFAEADFKGIRRWVQTSRSETREEVQGIQLCGRPAFKADGPQKRQVQGQKYKKKRRGKIPQFFAKREVEKYFTPPPPDAYLDWKKRRGHLFFKNISVNVTRKIELYKAPSEFEDEEELKPQAIEFAQPAYAPVLECLGLFATRDENEFHRGPNQKRKPLEFQRLTEFGKDYKRCAQKIFCTPYDANFWGSMTPKPTLDEGPTAASESTQLPDLVLPEMTDDFSWKPAPPLTRPPTVKKRVSKRGLPAPPKPWEGNVRKKSVGKHRSPLKSKLKRKRVKKAHIPPPPTLFE